MKHAAWRTPFFDHAKLVGLALVYLLIYSWCSNLVIEYDYTTTAYYVAIQGCSISRKGIGTVIGRRSESKGKEYVRIWIYVPTKVSEDTAFPLKIGDPCEVEIDSSKTGLTIRKLSQEKAYKLGWSRRNRFEKSATA